MLVNAEVISSRVGFKRHLPPQKNNSTEEKKQKGDSRPPKRPLLTPGNLNLCTDTVCVGAPTAL